jgi:hypothetical protein
MLGQELAEVPQRVYALRLIREKVIAISVNDELDRSIVVAQRARHAFAVIRFDAAVESAVDQQYRGFDLGRQLER